MTPTGCAPTSQSLVAAACPATARRPVFAGFIGSVGVDVYSPCIGLAAATGVTSRKVAYAIGIILAVGSFFPIAALKFVTVPDPIVGAILFFTAVFIFINGLQMITARMLDTRKTIVIGFSFAMLVLADAYKEVFATLPILLQPIFGSSLMLGTTCAVVLNAIMRIGVRQRERIRLEMKPDYRDTVEQFLIAQGGHWGARREIVNRAIFATVQSLEVIGERARRRRDRGQLRRIQSRRPDLLCRPEDRHSGPPAGPARHRGFRGRRAAVRRLPAVAVGRPDHLPRRTATASNCICTTTTDAIVATAGGLTLGRGSA